MFRGKKFLNQSYKVKLPQHTKPNLVIINNTSFFFLEILFVGTHLAPLTLKLPFKLWPQRKDSIVIELILFWFSWVHGLIYQRSAEADINVVSDST